MFMSLAWWGTTQTIALLEDLYAAENEHREKLAGTGAAAGHPDNASGAGEGKRATPPPLGQDELVHRAKGFVCDGGFTHVGFPFTFVSSPSHMVSV